MRRWLIVLTTLFVAVLCIASIERFGPVQGARIVEWLALLVTASVAAWAANGGWRNAMLVICSLLFGLVVLEGVLKVIPHPEPSKPSVETFTDSGLNGPREILGWGPSKPGTYRVVKKDGSGAIVYDVRVTIDAARNRISRPAGPGQVVFFGDSFIFGDGVADADTLPQAFSALNGGKIPVLNLAFSGWSPAQNLAALQTGLYRSIIDHPRHFILFTSPFHIERTACKGAWGAGTSPRYVLADGTVSYRGACSGRLWSSFVHFAERFAFYRRMAAYFATPTRADADTYLAIISEFVQTARRQYGVKTTVLFEPTDDKALTKATGYNDDQLVAALRHAGIDVLVDQLPPIEDPSLYWIPNEGHPTALAYKAMAREIEDHLEAVDPAVLTASEPSRDDG